jgi:regulatory protein
MRSPVSCYNKALDLLARRSHSRAELGRKLAERGYDENELQQTLDRLTAARLLDDRAYAQRQAERMLRGKGFAPRRIAQELRMRGVDSGEIDAALSAIEDHDPRKAISLLLESKFARSLADEKGRKRTVSALARMGYSWQDIRGAIRRYETEEILDE